MAVQFDAEFFNNEQVKELRQNCVKGASAMVVYVKMLAKYGRYHVKLHPKKNMVYQIADAIGEPITEVVANALAQMQRCGLIVDMGDREFDFVEMPHMRFVNPER